MFVNFKHYFLLFLVLVSVNSSFSLPVNDPSVKLDFATQTIKRFNQLVGLAQEKVYVQTDKPYYSAGENIWFKASIVNAATHVPSALSKFVYVELIDKSDSVFQRIKIKDSLGFAGRFVLPTEMPSGHYTLRAYSYWMRNSGDDFLFKKNIFIGNAIDDRVNATISYSAPANGKVIATISFKDANKNPMISKSVVGVVNWTGKEQKAQSLTTDKNGNINIPITLSKSTFKNKKLSIELKDAQLKFNQSFFLPSFNKDFDIQFFPEGGDLIANCLQNVAFKAVGSSGLGVDVTGSIVDSIGNSIFQFKSSFNGIGQIMLEAKPGEKYYAIVKSADGIEKKVQIKSATKSGVLLQLKTSHSKIYYQINNKSDVETNMLYLLIHARGQLMAVKQLDSLALTGQISESLLPTGIVSFSIINSVTGKVFSERLAFVTNPTTGIVNMKTDKPQYGKREFVDLDFNIATKDSLPVLGNFAVSVADSKTVKNDSLAGNILSSLLLTSDLKGYIEDPGSYFCGNKNERKQRLDLLMLTQGWKRFNTEDVINGKVEAPKYYLEAGQAISGKVLDILGNPSKGADIIMLSPGLKNTTKFVKTDNQGKFIIDGISFADSTTYLLKAKKSKNFGDVEIIPDLDDFPKATTFIPLKDLTAATSEIPVDYLSQIREKYFYEGGIRMGLLDELVVTAQKKDPNENQSYYSGMADNSLSAEALDKMPGLGILNVLATIAGVQVTGEDVAIRGSQGPPMLMIDDMEQTDLTELPFLTTNDVANIAVFKGANAAIFGSKGGNGVVAITLKKGVEIKARASSPSLAIIKPLGFQKSVQFYTPKYEVDSVLKNANPDLRTTIYWNPKLISKSNGSFNAKFPTADKPNDYTVTLEGVSKSGEIYRYIGVVRRKNE